MTEVGAHEVWSGLAAAARSIGLLGTMAPQNFQKEVARLTDLSRSGGEGAPAFEYPESPPDLRHVRAYLEAIAESLRPSDPLSDLAIARTEELQLEAELCEFREATWFHRLAKTRFEGLVSREEARRAVPLASAEPEQELIAVEDATDSRSLISRVRALLGELRLGVRLVLTERLVPVAAVSEGTLYLGKGRALDVEASARTAIHEVLGHLWPQSVAQKLGRPLLVAGTARGSDTQEGYALTLERACGFLSGARATELVLRYEASVRAHDGLPFEETLRELRPMGPLPDVVRSACRAYRGGGLGRESAYLEAFAQVSAFRFASPEAFGWLAAGRVSTLGASELERTWGEPPARPFSLPDGGVDVEALSRFFGAAQPFLGAAVTGTNTPTVMRSLPLGTSKG